MVHDRAAFGGTLVGIGIVYVWLTLFPLAAGQQWAWWVWLVSGSVGFLSFLSYLGYGYLDTWHGVATLALLPPYVAGMARSRQLVGPLDPRNLGRHGGWLARRDRFAVGRGVLLLRALATASGGVAVLRVGLADTFVPEDLAFMGLSASELRELSPRLVPLLAPTGRASVAGWSRSWWWDWRSITQGCRPKAHLVQLTRIASRYWASGAETSKDPLFLALGGKAQPSRRSGHPGLVEG